MTLAKAAMTTTTNDAPAMTTAAPATNNTTPQKRKSNNNNNRRRGNGGNDKRPKDVQGSNESNINVSNVCFQWAKNGACARGDGCRFSHSAEANESSSNANNEGDAAASKKKNNTRKKRNNKKGNNQQPPAGGDVQNQEMMKEALDDVVMQHEAKEGVAPNDDGDNNDNKLHITSKMFADLKISAESRRAMSQEFQYEFMTVVQAETLPVILEGNDCLAKAKTGTGKTLAFMIPAVEKILEQRNNNNSNSRNNNYNNNAMDISCLIISPTRELTFQICAEAQRLVKFQKNMRVVACVGGTNINADKKALQQSVQFLVATPGRLLDHMTNTETNGVKLVKRLEALQVLILDEADQLLDMGFRPDIQRILNMLAPSRPTRQTLLFSATVPDSVSEIGDLALRSSYKYVDTVGEDQEQTHLHVKQELYVTRQGAEQVRAIWQILLAEIAQATAAKEPYKIIVFFTTARLTGFVAELLNSMSEQKRGFGQVLEIHSRKSQPVRQKVSDKFRKEKTAVLFSSDVSARGMDYPDVTFVLQVGLTDRAHYTHRLGRTARAGKNGKGGLLLAVEEEKFMTQIELQDMPLIKVPMIPNGTTSTSTNTNDCPLMQALNSVARDKVLKESAEQAYRAWLGYYNGHLKKVGWNKKQLVVAANQWVKDMGIEQPKIQRKTVGKMGLKGVPGLLLE